MKPTSPRRRRARGQDWQRIRHLFEQSVDLGAAQRDEFLSRELPSRADLQEELRRLLDESGRGQTVLDHSAVDLMDNSCRTHEPDLVGQEVGGYTIRSLISSGGMGDVYLAERAVGSSLRRVAVKVLKRGLDTDALLARFRTEQEVLAGLRHDHVVSFLDAGALEDGRPFFVMEHVDGEPITTYCRDHDLDVTERLELFLKVCEAVQVAHQNLVLHRDLKPSNILVTESGTPKLLDFGVAKVLAPDGNGELTDPIAATPLTLRYASPEQIRREHVAVTTDVYSLGILLHELLTGRPAPGLRRLLRGNLEAIVLRATHSAADHRYASVALLTEDLRRHLAGQPVSARHESLLERTSRFARRNRWQCVAGLVLFLCLGAGFLGTWVEKRRAQLDASTGWGAHGQARRAAEFLENLLVLTADGTGDLAGWSILLDNAEEQVLSKFTTSAETEALARIALGHIAISLGEWQRASRNLERALELARTQRGLNQRDEARTNHLLGIARMQQGDPRATANLRLSVEQYGSLRYPDEEGLAAARRTLGQVKQR